MGEKGERKNEIMRKRVREIKGTNAENYVNSHGDAGITCEL